MQPSTVKRATTEPLARLAIALFAGLVLTAPVTTQGWRDEQIREVGLQFRAPHYLERIPQRLGAKFSYTRARLEPKKKKDLVDGRLKWTVLVLEFQSKTAADKQSASPKAHDPEEARRLALKKLTGRSTKKPVSFRAWIDLSKDVKILTEGAMVRAKGSKLPYRHWVWKLEKAYAEAAVYDLNGSEVALVVWMPLVVERGKKPPKKPSARWTKLTKSILKSGEALTVDADAEVADAGDRRRDLHADTPAKKKALAAAKENIAGLKGWDYFTTPNYIVFFSWQDATSHARNASRNRAKHYSSRLERMRELYVKNYPLDGNGRALLPDPSTIPSVKPKTGPITGNPTTPSSVAAKPTGKKQLAPLPYSVLRFCATEAQFQKYGQSPRGVVGWFSPSSKELVVFLGGDERLGKGATEAVVYHEGWHQYGNTYFDTAVRTKHDQLHRWFDEGLGDYFGGHQLIGGKWRYIGSTMRGKAVKKMIDQGRTVGLRQLCEWPRSQFYGRNAGQNYAIAWSLVDFLSRGSKLRRHWQPRYGDVLESYKNVMLMHGDSSRAMATAFPEFTPEDWRQLEKDWKAWVRSGHYKDGH